MLNFVNLYYFAIDKMSKDITRHQLISTQRPCRGGWLDDDCDVTLYKCMHACFRIRPSPFFKMI